MKHILRAIRRDPARPLFLALVVALAVAIAVTAVGASDMFLEHAYQTAAENQELGDILITPRGDSGSRFLWSDDAEAVIGEDGAVLGEFRLSGFATFEGEEVLLSLSALDLEKADRFFEFTYPSYGRFTTQNLNQAVILSESAAKTYGLAVGDTLTLRILETDLVYTVEAIAADKGLLKEVDMLISMSGILQTLAARVPVIGTFGDADYPYTRLLVKCSSPTLLPELLARLTASPRFADKLIQQIDGSAQLDFWLVLQLVFLWMVALLLLILCGVVITGALSSLHDRRRLEYELFHSIGATARQIHAAVYLESGFYALAGALLGTLLALPLNYGVMGLYSWYTPAWQLSPLALLTGILFPFALMYACTAIHLRHADATPIGRGEAAIPLPRQKEYSRLAVCLPAAISAVFFILLFTLPIRWRFIPMVVLLLSLTWLAFVLTPLLLRQAAGWLETRLERRDTDKGWLLLAVKNLRNHTSIRHIGKMLAVLTMLVITVLSCERSIAQYADLLGKDVPFDMLMVNASDTLRDDLRKDEDVAGVMEMTYVLGVQLPNGGNATAISLSGDTALWHDADMIPQKIPEGRELALARGLAILAQVEVGDTVPLVIGGVSYEFTVSEIMDIHPNFLYFDANELGIRYDLLCLFLGEGNANATERLRNTAQAAGTAVLPATQAFGVAPSTMSGHTALLRYAVYAAVFLSLVGCLSILLDHYRARRGERHILQLSGMTVTDLRHMHLTEGALALLGALPIALLGCAMLCLVIHLGLHSFGMMLFV